jgi:hypothetical protein
MYLFAIIFAGRYGNGQPGLGPVLSIILLIFMVAVFVAGIINQKKRDQSDKSVKPKDGVAGDTGDFWKCPVCGERLEHQFSSCWKCGGSKPQ